MPNKLIKIGFKVWCCCCCCSSYCGYLCNFHICEGRPLEPVSGEFVSEKGVVSRVVNDLINLILGSNHMVYMDNFFTKNFVLVQALSRKGL